MVRITALFLMAATVGLNAPRALAQSHKLSATYTPGMHWQLTADNTGRIRTTETPMGMMNSPGFMQEKAKAECRVMEAENGKFKVLEIDFGKCELHVQMPGGARTMHPDHQLSGKKVRIERRFDPDTRQEKFDITAQGAALAPDVEDSIRGYFCVSLMPDKPVQIGQRWKSERVDYILGPRTRGSMELRFLQVERTPAGRQRAVVQIGGEATMEFSGTGGAAGNVDLSVDYGFNGNMKIDLETGQVQAIDLNGPMRLNHGANIGQGIVQRGDWTYRWEGTRLEPVATAAAEAPVVAREPALAGAGEPNPLDDAGPDPYTGTFKDDRLVLELKPTPPGYMGILRFGGKTFPVVAVRRGNALEGRFQSGNSEFPFTAATDTQGAKLTFTSGRTAHTLVKEAAVNPLEAPAATILDGQRDNPLAR